MRIGLGLDWVSQTIDDAGMSSTAVDRVKILVLGDSGVGKSSAVQLICSGKPGSLSSTIGCNVEVKLHEYKEGTNDQRTFFAEFWEIGGNSGHAAARKVFYNSVHGIILVHDLTNKKSHENLRRWLADAMSSSGEYDAEMFADLQVPVLVIGTKAGGESGGRTISIADLCGAEQINMDALSERGLPPGSSNAVKLSRFLDKVIQKRYFSKNGSSPQSNYLDRRRPATSPKYLQHVD